MAVALETRDGAEVRIETGYGRITKLDDKGNRNAHVSIDAEHLDDPVQGWADTTNFDQWARIQEAHAKAFRIAYRVVVKRKAEAPQDCPLEEVPKRQRVRDLEFVQIVGGDNQPLDPDAASGAAQDAQGSQPPPEGDSAPQAATRPASRSADGRRGPRIEEAKPWEPYNSDGSLNLGSYAVTAALGFVEWAHELCTARATYLAKAEGIGFAPPPASKVRELARLLLHAADRAQATVRSDGRSDRMDNSHTRCRGAVRTCLDALPVPWDVLEADDYAVEQIRPWVDALGKRAAGLVKVAVDLVDVEAELR